MIRVLEPGLMTTVQDRGRWGHQDLGVPVAGPMDECSHRLANRLVGNSFELATLEVTLVGPSLEFLAETTCVVVGARFELWLDGVQVQTGRAFRVPRGGGLRFGRRHAGARAYLAVAGGIDVPPVLGSRSTDLASRLGGLGGRPLRAGDRLVVGPSTGRPPFRGLVDLPFRLPVGGARVRVMSGPDRERMTSEALALFPQVRFTIEPESNRMGYRLGGGVLALADTEPLLSGPTPVGTVQVPPSGLPIVLMVDRQTTGGYVRIATVISADLPVAGQLGPGDWLAFELCERREAIAALVGLEQRLMQIS